MEIFQEFKESFHFLYPQVKHKTSVWPHLPHCCLPLGTQRGGTQWKRAPHKAHTSLCNFDYQVINYHGILNILYSTIHFSLQQSFFLFSSQWSMLYVMKSARSLSLSLYPSPAGLTAPGEFRSCSGMQHTFMPSEMPLYCRQLHLFHFQFLLYCK